MRAWWAERETWDKIAWAIVVVGFVLYFGGYLNS